MIHALVEERNFAVCHQRVSTTDVNAGVHIHMSPYIRIGRRTSHTRLMHWSINVVSRVVDMVYSGGRNTDRVIAHEGPVMPMPCPEWNVGGTAATENFDGS